KGQTVHVAAPIGDEVIVLRTDDSGIGKGVFVYRWRKDLSGLREAIERLDEWGVKLPPSPVFVDVGANIGTTTVMALRRFGFESSVSIEPAPGNFLALRVNVVANDLESRVTAINAAVSDREAQVQFDISRPSCGAFRIAKDDAERTVPVEAVTL